MNRPRRPPFSPGRKKKPTPARSPETTGPPRRRSPLDNVPANLEPRFQVLGTGVDRQALLTFAAPMEMLVLHGFTREIEDAYQRFNGRVEDFWAKNPDVVAQARKLDEVLAAVMARKRTAS